MKSRKILLADNDSVFLTTCAEFLESAGYRVITVSSPIEARDMLETVHVHLAILDLRLNNDEERDRSGLLIAKEVAPSTPKIILTKFPAHEDVRDAMRLDRGGLPPAVDYVDKRKELGVLLEAVDQAFVHHVRMNWDLKIEWKESTPYGIANLIEPGLEGSSLLDHADELEELLCCVFYRKDHIRIRSLLWHRNGRVALVVLAFKDGGEPETFLVVCGQNSIIQEEARRFIEFAPKTLGETGTELYTTEETIHFAANVYAFANIDLESVQSLYDLYRFAHPKMFKDNLKILIQKTLAEWHQDRLTRANQPLGYMYRNRLNLPVHSVSQTYFEERLLSIEKVAIEHRLRIERGANNVSFTFGERAFSYPDPLPLLSQAWDERVALTVRVPGDLTGENILVDGTGHAWLTDFVSAGQAPLFWNYVALESIIRFDWTYTENFLRQQELENCFINGDFSKPDIRGLEPELQKPAQALVTLRKSVIHLIDQDVADYHLGIFFQGLRRLADFNPAYPLSTAELMRLIHIYLVVAMLGSKIIDNRPVAPSGMNNQVDEIDILDRKTRLILVGNRQTYLRSLQLFTLFSYLFDKDGATCTKEELISEALHGKYSAEYIHTLVMRLRKEIEDDPNQPRYLVTEPSIGYRLIHKPQ